MHSTQRSFRRLLDECSLVPQNLECILEARYLRLASRLDLCIRWALRNAPIVDLRQVSEDRILLSLHTLEIGREICDSLVKASILLSLVLLVLCLCCLRQLVLL